MPPSSEWAGSAGRVKTQDHIEAWTRRLEWCTLIVHPKGSTVTELLPLVLRR